MERDREDLLLVMLQDVKNAQKEHGAEMRFAFGELRSALAVHEREDVHYYDKVNALEEKLADGTGFWRHLQSLIVPAGLLVVWEGIKHFTGWK